MRTITNNTSSDMRFATTEQSTYASVTVSFPQNSYPSPKFSAGTQGDKIQTQTQDGQSVEMLASRAEESISAHQANHDVV